MDFARTTDGAELAWTQDGAGEALLLIAGQATGMAGWDPTANALAEHFRVIRFDHRGIGASTKGGADRYTTRSLSADAVSVLDAAGVDAAHIYGHSMGGRIAQWLAVDYPNRVLALVLAGTSGGGRGAAEREPSATEALLSADANRMAPLFFDPDWTEEHPDSVHAFFDTRASTWAKSRHFKASAEHDAWDFLGSIRAPTLILHGTDDVLTPLSNARRLHQHIRNSTLVKVPGARHGLHLDHPETIEWIRQFITAKTGSMLPRDGTNSRGRDVPSRPSSMGDRRER